MHSRAFYWDWRVVRADIQSMHLQRSHQGMPFGCTLGFKGKIGCDNSGLPNT